MRRIAISIPLLASLALAVGGCSVRDAPAEFVPPGAELAVDPLGPVLLVGIDGATFSRIEPLIAAGRLPVIEGLMSRGAWAPLETLEPTVSPAIWTTIATGKLPDAHGILGFEGVPGESMKTLPTSQMRQVRAFWNVMSEHDRDVGVIGWWATWPAEAVEGYVVSDRVAYTRMEATLGADDRQRLEVFPPEIETEVLDLVRKPSEIQASDVRRFMELSDDEIQQVISGTGYRYGAFVPEFKYVHQSDRSTVEIAKHLMATREVGVTAVALYGVDTVSHLAWHLSEPEAFPEVPPDAVSPELIRRFGGVIDAYYEYADELLGELIESTGPDTTVVVFSDHGFGPTGHLPWSGGHGRITPGAPIAPDGILIVAGPDVREAGRVDRAHVLDVMPTILYFQGLPRGDDMPGRVLTELLEETVVAERPVASIPTYETVPQPRIDTKLLSDPELDAATIEKLKALGYLPED
jgi:predicted AlkP superfamily phosphohydrolase/phosphomutase